MASAFPIPGLLLLCFCVICSLARPIAPSFKTFTFVNDGEFGELPTENHANYRLLDIESFPMFRLCFYNSTPNNYVLAVRMGNHLVESTMRWVWEANRADPVRDGATLSLRSDGDLVLADVDGRVVWSTGTSNKDVAGIRLLPDGNLVIHDRREKFVWQSFDHPTDTLLMGQSLRSVGPTKLVSRLSDVDSSDGAYSLIMEPSRFAMYVENSLIPLPYYLSSNMFNGSQSLATITFIKTANELRLEYGSANGVPRGSHLLTTLKYDNTLSFLRLGQDGNLKIYTYYDEEEWGAWEVTFELFSNGGQESECRLPSRCGKFGLCENSQCVACPRPRPRRWSENCVLPELPPCESGDDADYYKVVGVEHFANRYVEGEGAVEVAECREKCSKDCKCVGFFYWEESSKCLLAPVLNTLVKVSDSSHVAYIKFSKEILSLNHEQ